jgi:hypothetical protein
MAPLINSSPLANKERARQTLAAAAAANVITISSGSGPSPARRRLLPRPRCRPLGTSNEHARPGSASRRRTPLNGCGIWLVATQPPAGFNRTPGFEALRSGFHAAA